MIVTYYRDFYGYTVSIKQRAADALLTVRTLLGKIVHYKQYKTAHGARIAIGKLSDSWHFVSMKQSGKTRIVL